MKPIVIVIPSLNPTEKMISLIEELQDKLKFGENPLVSREFLIVNDGSTQDYDEFFQRAQNDYGCTVLKHAVNQGKGRALKTAFNHCLIHFPELVGVVTVDSDGQHAVDDIISCAKALVENPENLIMGCRDFDSEDVPFKSKAGNKITRQVFKFLCGVSVSDTQTGLRGIPTSYVKDLMIVPGERFEFEMNMLIESKGKISITEVPIQTIYEDQNSGSHFNPLLDSARIYKVFLKYIFSAFSSFIVDMSLFALFQVLLRDYSIHYIFIATVAARVISSIFNFWMNRSVVFQGDQSRGTFIKYYILAGCQMLASAFGASFVFKWLPLNEVVSKMLVDILLFFISFPIQRGWVFKSKK